MDLNNRDWRSQVLREELSILDRRISAWKKRDDKILTEERIAELRVIAEKNLSGASMSHSQRSTKSEIHQKLRDAFADIERMALFEFIGCPSRWDPSDWGERGARLPYSDLIWSEDFPVEGVAVLVRRLISMFGEKYAVPLAYAIEEGYRDHLQDSGISVEVPIIIRASLPPRPKTKDALSTARRHGETRSGRYTDGSKSMVPLPHLPDYKEGVRVQRQAHRDLAEF